MRESPRGKATLRNSTRSKSLERTTPGHDLSARANVAKVDNSQDGAFMEPSGRSQWRPVARDGDENGSLKRKPVAVGCDQLPESFHGKEGVDGSSPSEGLSSSL